MADLALLESAERELELEIPIVTIINVKKT